MIRNPLLSIAFLGLVLSACSDKISTFSPVNPVTNMVSEEALDRSVDKCANFYDFACGNWVKNTQIPSGNSSWYRSFSTIDENNLGTLHALLLDYSAGKNTAKIASAKKLGDYFATCMDEQSAEKATLSVLPTELQKISSLSTKQELYSYIAELHMRGVGGLFSFSADQDYAVATRIIGVADKASLGLPDRDYYLSQTPKKADLRDKYVAHVAKMLTLSGVAANNAQSQAVGILGLETELAKHMLSLEERRDPSKIYHLINKAGLVGLSSEFAWDSYFTGLGIASVTLINVAEPEYFKALNDVLKNTSLDDLKTYLRWRFLHATAGTLGKNLRDENFAFYSKTLQGQAAPKERWKTCVQATDALGEALGEAYVGLKFSEEAKATAKEMIQLIRTSVAENFKTIDWMDDATKTRALDKLGKISPKIGYPDKWRDYSALFIDRSSFLENSQRADKFESQRVFAKIGNPVDRAEWGMFPHTVNAYYNPSMNEIVFPAAILQSPFFDARANTGANYGAIGMVMGHETTHAFDDEGRSFDGDGNLKDWWSPEVAAKFETRTQCLIKQYDGYTVSGGVHLNGKLTLGENIADLGGLKLAWTAYKKATQGKQPAPGFSGFSEDQQFFIAYAQSWCAKATPEYEQLQAQTNPHSAAQYRVNGVVVNLPEFQKAFSCESGTPMAPVNRCQVW